ncbi:MAG: L-threonylcarbamoyladenylate synthase [Robiginitomaculum sp.]
MAQILYPSLKHYKMAAAQLMAGDLVALPTETVYGLAALADNQAAVKKIYTVKSRPKNKLLPHIALSKKVAQKLAIISPLAHSLMDRYWPGPLTLVLPKNGKNGETIALRHPATGWAKAFASMGFDTPLVLPSANTSGLSAPITAAQVNQDIGNKISLIIDGGTVHGTASTILKIEGTKITLLRAGALSPEKLAGFSVAFQE